MERLLAAPFKSFNPFEGNQEGFVIPVGSLTFQGKERSQEASVAAAPLTGGEGGTQNREDVWSCVHSDAEGMLERGLLQAPWAFPVERAHGPSPGSPQVEGIHPAGTTPVGQPHLPGGPAAPGRLHLALWPESIFIHN